MRTEHLVKHKPNNSIMHRHGSWLHGSYWGELCGGQSWCYDTSHFMLWNILKVIEPDWYLYMDWLSTIGVGNLECPWFLFWRVELLCLGTFSQNFVYPSVLPSFCPSVCLSVRISVRPSVSPSLRPSVRPSFRPFVSPSIRPSVSPSVR